MSERTDTVGLCAVQFESSLTDPVSDNLARAVAEVEAAVRDGAEMVCLQEFFSTGGFTWTFDPALFDLAEDVTGVTVTTMRRLAERLGIWILCPFFERDTTVMGRCFNSTAVIDPTGVVTGLFRKLHLPLNGRSWEKFYFAPGNLGVPVFEHSRLGIRFAVMMCFDRHFGAVARQMLVQDVDVIFVPTSTSSARPGRQEIWVAELRSIAVSTSAYVVGANSTGNADGKVQFGTSAIVGPNGSVLGEMGSAPGHVRVDVDPRAGRGGRASRPGLGDAARQWAQRASQFRDEARMRALSANEAAATF